MTVQTKLLSCQLELPEISSFLSLKKKKLNDKFLASKPNKIYLPWPRWETGFLSISTWYITLWLDTLLWSHGLAKVLCSSCGRRIDLITAGRTWLIFSYLRGPLWLRMAKEFCISAAIIRPSYNISHHANSETGLYYMPGTLLGQLSFFPSRIRACSKKMREIGGWDWSTGLYWVASSHCKNLFSEFIFQNQLQTRKVNHEPLVKSWELSSVLT